MLAACDLLVVFNALSGIAKVRTEAPKAPNRGLETTARARSQCAPPLAGRGEWPGKRAMAVTLAYVKANFAVVLHICHDRWMKSELPDSQSAGASVLAAELRIVIGALRRRLREQADIGDLTSAQTSVLLRLERDGPATGSALARAEAMRPQSMGAIIAALETAGYVAGAPDPSDGRQTIVSLTDHFRNSVSAARAARQDWLLAALQARLSAQEQRQLADAVELLKRLTDS